VLALALSACAAPTDTDEFQRHQSELLRTELSDAEAVPHRGRSLYYLGIALYSEAWSQNDVVGLGEELRGHVADYAVRPLVFSNYGVTEPSRYAMVSSKSIDAAVRLIALRSTPDDLVVVAISSHGGPGLLSQKVADQNLAPVSADVIKHGLAPLEDRKTVIILSACFSGSLIGSLKTDNRIIIAAARDDRTSFGCAADADHTVFGQVMIDALAPPGQSLRAIVERMRANVAAVERRRHFTPPSDPQVFVGRDMTALYDQPVF